MPEDSATHLVVLDADGSILARIQVPAGVGVRSFDVDPQHHALYLMSHYDGVLLRARLPAKLGF